MATSFVLVVGTLTAMVLLSSRALNGDVAYVLGGLVTGGAAGYDVVELFLARPLVHRTYMGALLSVVNAMGLDAASVGGMIVIRLCGWLTAALAAWVLWRGLLLHASRSVATWASLGVGLALVASPNWYVLQPDWLGVVLAVAGVGVGLWGGRRLGPLLAGVLFALAIGAKIAAIPWVLLALLIVALLAPRRAAWAAASTTVVAAAMFGIQRGVLPWEIQWLQDQVELVHASPLSTGITPKNVLRGIKDSIDVAVLNPIIWAAVPAVLVLVVRRPSARSRVLAAGWAVIGLALSVASGYGQGEHFAYHWVGMPVVAAGALGWALAQDRRGRVPLLLGGFGSALLAVAATTQTQGWRAINLDGTAVAFGLLVLASGGLALAAHRSPRPRGVWVHAPTASALAVACLLIVPLLPTSPGSFAMYNSHGRVGAPLAGQQTDLDTVARIRNTVPADVPVLYLTYGATNFLVGNPATCRYPSPQWLQRAASRPEISSMSSYRDNLTCLTPARPAFLVWDSQWFPQDRMPSEVKAYVDTSFDCSASRRMVITHRKVWVCPRRPGA